jgi:hypothetical protein
VLSYAALAGCGGQTTRDASEVEAGGSDASQPDAPGGNDASQPDALAREAGEDSGTSPEASSDASDAGACVSADGAPCDYGVVPCGTSACPVPITSVCCETAGDAGTTATCESSSACPVSSLVVACDEAADCNGGTCCFVNIPGGVTETYCWDHVASCGGHQSPSQVCKTQPECASGKTCTPESCTLAGVSISLGFCLGPSDPKPPIGCTPQ